MEGKHLEVHLQQFWALLQGFSFILAINLCNKYMLVEEINEIKPGGGRVLIRVQYSRKQTVLQYFKRYSCKFSHGLKNGFINQYVNSGIATKLSITFCLSRMKSGGWRNHWKPILPILLVLMHLSSSQVHKGQLHSLMKWRFVS